MTGALWLYLRCDDRVLAIAADTIERALLVDEVPPPALPPLGAPPGCVGALTAHGARYAAWDLGTMLGLTPSRRAWILAHVAGAQGRLPVALRTDDCLHVGPFPGDASLTVPRDVFVERPAFPRAFPVARVRGLRGVSSPVGFELDLDLLWSDDERRQMLAMRAADAGEEQSGRV